MAGKSGAIKQGRAFVELFVDDSKLVKGLRKAEVSVRNFGNAVGKGGKSMMLAASAILSPLAYSVRLFSKQGSELKDMSMRTGIAVESLSAFEYVASQTGTSLQSFEKGIRLSQKAIGSLSGQKSLTELGINIAKIKSLSPEDQFIAIADYIGKIPNQADRAAAAMKVFGKGGAELLPLMSEGSGGIQNMMDEAKKLGIVMSTEDANSADEFGDSLASLNLQIKRMIGSVGGSLAPVIQEYAKLISEVIPRISDWVKNNQALIITVAKTAAYAIMFGAALVTVGTGISAIASLIKIIRVAWLSIMAIGAAITSYWFSIPLLIAAVALQFQSMVGGIQNFSQAFNDTVSGMVNALKRGDIKKSGEILWTGLKLMWAEGTRELSRLWDSMLAGMMKQFYSMAGMLPPVMIMKISGKLPSTKDFIDKVDADLRKKTRDSDNRISELKKTLSDLNQNAKAESEPPVNITEVVTGYRIHDIDGGSAIDKQNSVMGSFYASSALSYTLGSENSSFAKRTADAAERTADACEEMADGGGFYGA